MLWLLVVFCGSFLHKFVLLLKYATCVNDAVRRFTKHSFTIKWVSSSSCELQQVVQLYCSLGAICSLLHCTTCGFIIRFLLAAGCHLQTIKKYSPVIYKFFLAASDQDIELAQPIINSIISKLNVIQRQISHQLEAAVENTEIDSSFPNLPKLVERGNYNADNSGSKENLASCSKLGKRQRNLIPGIFLLHCQHGKNSGRSIFICHDVNDLFLSILWIEFFLLGVCYSFQLMDSHESPNTPYSVIRTRFSVGMCYIVVHKFKSFEDRI